MARIVLASRQLLMKGVIRTPLTSDGKVDYERVPVGSSIWVSVSDPSSPLHGRPILLTKRPDKQFALTGGAGYRHLSKEEKEKTLDPTEKRVSARRHSVVAAGRDVRATQKDIEEEHAYTAAKEANLPLVTAKKELSKQLRKQQSETTDQFMQALGVKAREFSKQELTDIKDKARKVATDAGLEGEDAEHFANIVNRELARAKKKTTDRYAQMVGRFLYETFGKRREKEEGLELTPTTEHPEAQEEITWPVNVENVTEGAQVDPVGWLPMGGASLAGSAGTETAVMTLEAPTLTVTIPEVSDFNTPEEMEASIVDAVDRAIADAMEAYQAKLAEELETKGEAMAGTVLPAITEYIESDEGDEEIPAAVQEIAEGLSQAAKRGDSSDVDEARTIELTPAVEQINIADEEARNRAIEAYRQYHETRAQVRELEKKIMKLPELQNATPAALENLKTELQPLSDKQFEQVVEEYENRLRTTSDDALYAAVGDHWNDTAGDRVHSYMVEGASSAITALVGEYIGERFDVGRLVEHMSIETACWATAAMLYRQIKDPAQYDELRSRVEAYNAKNQDRAENEALKRYYDLKKDEAEIRRQQTAEELINEATSELLLTENLQAQREELGMALGSLSASAGLLQALDGVRRAAEMGETDRITLFCGPERKAAEDRVRKLNLREGRDAIIAPVKGGWAIQTSSAKLQRFIRKTQRDQAEFALWEKLKTDGDNVVIDDEGRAWAKGYKVPFWKEEFEDPFTGEMKPFSFSREQRNDIEWLDRAGGGLVTRVTGSGKTLTALAFIGKQLDKDPDYIGVVLAPNGRVEQWASEAARFTRMPVLVIPENTNAEERARVYREGVRRGQIIITSHRDGSSKSDLAILEAIRPDGLVIDEPQEMRSRTSAERGAGMKRVMKLNVKNKLALTATPAREQPVECYNIANWVAPGKLGYRTAFQRAYSGFKGGTNAQDALLQKMLLQEMAPFVSGDRLTASPFKVNQNEVRVKRSQEQIERQKQIELNAQQIIDETIEAVPQEERVGPWRVKARQKAIQKIMQMHAENLAGGAKVSELGSRIKSDVAIGRDKHVIFVDSVAQRRAVVAGLQNQGYKNGREIKNIAASTSSIKGAEIEKRKKTWAQAEGPSFIIIDRKSAAGHNLQQGHALHILGAPDDAAQYLQAQGRIVRVSRAKETGDADIYTYRYDDSPFESAHWRKLEAELKLLRATAPGLFKSWEDVIPESHNGSSAWRKPLLLLKATRGQVMPDHKYLTRTGIPGNYRYEYPPTGPSLGATGTEIEATYAGFDSLEEAKKAVKIATDNNMRYHVTLYANNILREGFQDKKKKGIGGPKSGLGVFTSKDLAYSLSIADHMNALERIRTSDDPLTAAEEYCGRKRDDIYHVNYVKLYERKLGRCLKPAEEAIVLAISKNGRYSEIPTDNFFTDRPARKFEVIGVRIRDNRRPRGQSDIFGGEELWNYDDVEPVDIRKVVSLPISTILGLKKSGEVKRPGSRGGKWYIDKKGKVRYGTRPDGKTKTSEAEDMTKPKHEVRQVESRHIKRHIVEQVSDRGNKVIWHHKSTMKEKPTLESVRQILKTQLEEQLKILKPEDADDSFIVMITRRTLSDPEVLKKELKDETENWEMTHKYAEKEGIPVEPGPNVVKRLFEHPKSGAFALNMKDGRLIIGGPLSHERIFEDLGMGETEYSEEHADNWLRGIIWHPESIKEPVLLFEMFGTGTGVGLEGRPDEEKAWRNIRRAAQLFRSEGVKGRVMLFDYGDRINELAERGVKEGWGDNLADWAKSANKARLVLMVKSSSDHVFNPEDRKAMETALREYVKEAHPDKRFNKDWLTGYT